MRTESSSRDQEPSSGNGIPESGLASMTGLANPGFAFTAEEPKVVVNLSCIVQFVISYVPKGGIKTKHV